MNPDLPFQFRKLVGQFLVGGQHLPKLEKARMMAILTRMARSLCSTLESIDTPCYVNTSGSFRRPPQLDVAICDFKFENSESVS